MTDDDDDDEKPSAGLLLAFMLTTTGQVAIALAGIIQFTARGSGACGTACAMLFVAALLCTAALSFAAFTIGRPWLMIVAAWGATAMGATLLVCGWAECVGASPGI